MQMKTNNIPGAIIIEGHVQGLSNARALGEAGIPVYLVDKNNCLALYSKYCTKFFRCPDFKSDDFIEFLMWLGEKENLHGWLLLPSNDHAVYNLAKNKEKLEQIFKLITPSLDIIEQIYNKENLLKNAAISQTSFPASWFPQSYDEKLPDIIGFPLLVKGKFGLNFYKSTGKKAFLVNNKNELKTLFVDLQAKLSAHELFVQELIPLNEHNKTLSFTAFCINGKIKSFWMGVKLREHPVQFGTATFAESLREESVLIHARKLLEQLNYTGICEVEFLQDPRDGLFKLIEINARTWLWVGLAKACGVNFALMAYHFVNRNTQEFPQAYKQGVKWRNIYTDTIFTFLALVKRKISITQIIRQNKGRIVDALWQRKDPIPSIMYLFLGFSFIRKR